MRKRNNVIYTNTEKYRSDMAQSNDRIKLVSGFSDLEKTPSIYKAFDLTGISKYLGMTKSEFENQKVLTLYSTTMVSSKDWEYTEYTLVDAPKGVNIILSASSRDDKISTCYIGSDDCVYNELSDEEKYSYLGVDFDMTVIQGENMKKEFDGSIELLLPSGDPKGQISIISIVTK